VFAAQTGAKEEADRAVAKLFYATAMPFNIADSTYSKQAVKAITACGPTYCPPGRKPTKNERVHSRMHCRGHFSIFRTAMSFVSNNVS